MSGSPLRIVVDMNLSFEWIDAFVEHGIDAIHWSSVGSADAPDESIMSWAASQQRVIFTNDLDFGRLLALSRGTTPSVFQLRNKYLLPDRMMSPVLLTLNQFADHLKSGALVVIDATTSRARLLPLRSGPLLED